MVSTTIIYVITWITTHLPTQEGWKAELAEERMSMFLRLFYYILCFAASGEIKEDDDGDNRTCRCCKRSSRYGVEHICIALRVEVAIINHICYSNGDFSKKDETQDGSVMIFIDLDF